MVQRCFFCGHAATLVHVHGHYQCSVCGTNALPCCDGDNCDTNMLLKQGETHAAVLQETSDNTLINNKHQVNS